MDFFSGIAAFVKEATDHLDGLILSFNEGADNSSVPRTSSYKRHLKEKTGYQDIMSSSTFKFLRELLADQDLSRRKFLKFKKMISNSAESFSMDEQQIYHARKVIQILPELDRLRFQLCPSICSDKDFWRIYFTILQTQEEKTLKKSKETGSRTAKTLRAKSHRTSKELIEPPTRRNGADNNDFDPAQTVEASIVALAQDVSMVSSIIVDGAKKTLRFAEQLIGSMEQQANEVITPTNLTSTEPKDTVQENEHVDKKPKAIAEIPLPSESSESDVPDNGTTRWKTSQKVETKEDAVPEDGWTLVDMAGKSHLQTENEDETESEYQLV